MSAPSGSGLSSAAKATTVEDFDDSDLEFSDDDLVEEEQDDAEAELFRWGTQLNDDAGPSGNDVDSENEDDGERQQSPTKDDDVARQGQPSIKKDDDAKRSASPGVKTFGKRRDRRDRTLDPPRYIRSERALDELPGNVSHRWPIDDSETSSLHDVKQAVRAGKGPSAVQNLAEESKKWILPSMQERAQAILEEHHKDKPAKQSKQTRTQRKDDEEGRLKMEKYLQYEYNFPAFSLQDTSRGRAAQALAFIASGKVPGLTPPDWLKGLSLERIERALAAARKGSTAIARKIDELLDSGREHELESDEVWMSHLREAVNVQVGADLGAMLAACVYLRVHLKNGKLVDAYVGRSSCAGIRHGEHMCTIFFHPTNKSYQYQTAKDADIILTFKLFTDTSLTRETAEAWEDRAIIEAVEALRFGTFTRNPAYTAVRSHFELPQLAIRGANATPCFEAPETGKARSYADDADFQNVAMLKVKARLRGYGKALLPAVASGNGLRHANIMARIRLAEEVLHSLRGQLLTAHQLIFTVTPEEVRGLDPLYVVGKDHKRMLRITPAGGKWMLGVRTGSESSLPSLTRPDRASYGGIALVAHPVGDASQEVVLYWNTGPLPVTLRDYFDELITHLPDLRQRREAHRRVVGAIKERRLKNHERLPIEARLAFDGLLFLNTYTADLKLYRNKVALLQDDDSRPAKLQELQSQCKLESSRDGFARYVPVRLGVAGDGSRPAIDPACCGFYHDGWTFYILLPTMPMWSVPCFQMSYHDRAMGQHPFAPVLAVYQALDPSLHASIASAGALPIDYTTTSSTFWPRGLVARSKKMKAAKSARIEFSRESRGQVIARMHISFTKWELETLAGRILTMPFRGRLWLQVGGHAVRRPEDLTLKVSADRIKWYDKQDFGLTSRARRNLFEWIKACRAADEADGFPFLDGVAAAEMLWVGEVEGGDADAEGDTDSEADAEGDTDSEADAEGEIDSEADAGL